MIGSPVRSATVCTVPFAPQFAYAALIFAVKIGSPGQWIGTIMSRGNESIETLFVSGSARSSITVSEREGVFAASLARWS